MVFSATGDLQHPISTAEAHTVACLLSSPEVQVIEGAQDSLSLLLLKNTTTFETDIIRL